MDYTDLYNFQTGAGIVVPNDASVLQGWQEKFQETFGTEIDLSAETPVGRLIEAMAVGTKTTLGVTAQVANQFNVNEATGIYLDSIAQIYDLKRIAGTHTKTTIKCYFSDSSTRTNPIPAGSYVLNSSTGNIFRVDGEIKNNQTDDEGRYFGIGTATAVDEGPVPAPEGSINSIQTAVLGWVGVTNLSPTYIGTNIETDEAFRKRILSSRPIGIGFDTHLESALSRINGVYSNCILENATPTLSLQKGISLPSHSIYVGLDFVETDDVKKAIATEIARAKPVGTGMVKSGVKDATLMEMDVSFGYGNGYTQKIYFYKVKKTQLLVNLSYSNGNYSGENIVDDIVSCISEYIDSIGAGGMISASLISNVLINRLDIGIGSILIQKSGSDSPFDTTVQMMGYETPFVLRENISLTEIK